MENKLKKIMASVFEVSEDAIDGNATSGTIESWDSLNHMKLIVALEEEFGIKFKDEEILEMQSFKLIKYMLSNSSKRAK